MNEISMDHIREVGEYWIVFLKEDKEPGHIQLSACANNFAIHRNYQSDDGRKCVGLHWEQDGCGYYELYNVGHTRICCPFQANPIQSLTALLRGKKGSELQREKYLDFERKLNSFGWKTIEP